MGGQQYVKGMVSVTSTPMVSATTRHPEGYTQDEGNHEVWWGPSGARDEYVICSAWTAEDGHRLLIESGELTLEGAAALAADLASWRSQVGG